LLGIGEKEKSFSFKGYITITKVSKEGNLNLCKEYYGKADYIICVPETMTKTH
jgi:hypothetical protein